MAAAIPPRHGDAIRRNWCSLLDEMDTEAVENHMIAQGALPLSKREELSTQTLRRRRREMLLEYVVARDSQVFECFLQALDAARQTHLSDRLRNG